MRSAHAAILLAAVIWGATFPIIDHALAHLGFRPLGFAFLRFAVASLALALWQLLRGRLDVRLLRDPFLWLVATVNTLGYASQYLAQRWTTAAKTGLLVNLNVILVAVLAHFLLRERHGRNVWLSLPVAAAGVVLLTTGGDLTRALLSQQEFRGDLLALLAGAAWALHSIATKSYVSRPHIDPTQAAVAVLMATTFLLWPLSWFLEGVPRVQGPAAWASVLYLGVVATAFAFVLWQRALRTEAATSTALLLLVEVVVALVLAVAWLGERLTVPMAWGAVLILAAAYWSNRVPKPAKRSQAA